MTRIIAGAAKGRRLAVPAAGTRPTSDRAREGLFNSLATRVELPGAGVLDLFAGSGAVGLEALSRGAGRALLIESGRAAADAATRNIAAVGLAGARLVRRPVAAVLADPADRHPEAPFELVFADPPYALDDPKLAAVLGRLAAGGWLAPEAMLVVERSARGPEPSWPDGVISVMNRRYGDAVLWYGRAR